MGPSGSGKSTLLHCLAALDTPSSGRVFLGPTELTSLSRRQQAQVRRDRIGFVFQAFNLVPTLDAIENITLPQLLAGRRPDRQWLEYVVAQIGLGDRMHHRPSQLSGGQQQRVALARALAGRPEVIFADEPTGNLDTKASGEMLALLRSAVDDFRQTVVTVTHDPAIAGYADLVLFFTDGRVVDQVVHPGPDLVLEHLQYVDSSTTAHVKPRGQPRVSTQSDGQQIMRSRRRRHDQTGPGRPMVGSDDEVEVARQERWLQRIREQFEVEHDAAAHDQQPDVEPSSNSKPFGHLPASGSEAPGHVRASSSEAAAVRGYDGSGNGFHPDPRHDTSNGYDTAASYDSGNGYHTGNGVTASYDAGNGHNTGNGHVGSRDPYGHSAPAHNDGAYRNGHTDARAIDAGDTSWLPAERSWLSDTGAQVDADPPAASNEAIGHPPASRPGRWHTNDWDVPDQPEPNEVWAPADTYRDPDLWASGERDGAADDGAADDGWSSITPQTASAEQQAQPAEHVQPAEQWDTRGAAQQNGWHIDESAQHNDAAPAPSSNGHGDSGWQRWEPDQHTAAGANGNGYHDNGYPDDAQYHQGAPGHHTEVYEQHHERPAVVDESRAMASSGWQIGEPDMDRQDDRTYEHASGEWYPPDEGSSWARHDDEGVEYAQEVEYAREPASLDIWAPNDTAEDASYQVPPAEIEHSGELHQPVFVSDPVAGEDLPLIDEPHDLPAGAVPQSRPSDSTTTDPFEALQSLQSQLNRLGTGRRPPRRHGG
jgi:putative ABC transport system ATP-binding protein